MAFLRSRLTTLLFVSILAMLIAAGCGGGSQPSGDSGSGGNGSAGNDTMATDNIIFLAGPQGGAWYAVSAAVAEILMDEIPGTTVTAIEGGSVANVKVINQGVDGQIGMTWTSFFYDALVGGEAFQAEGPQENVAAVMSMQRNFINIIVPADSGINSLEDLKDKRVLPGQPGGGGELVFRKLMEMIGYTYDDIKANGGNIIFSGYGDGPALMKDGHIDAVVVPGPAPHSLGMEVESTMPVKQLSIDEDLLKRLGEELPGFGYEVVPAGIYKGMTEDALVPVSYTLLIVNKNLPEDFVYEVTKALFENRDQLAAVHPDFGFISEENFLLGFEEAHLHPGAARYYEENIKK